jgi:hypothetical protein
MSINPNSTGYGAAKTPTTLHKFAGTYNADTVDHVSAGKKIKKVARSCVPQWKLMDGLVLCVRDGMDLQ